MQEMTSRQRMMTALTGGIPDRVPCAPDMSYMIPSKLTGKPFYDVLLYQNPPLWKAYIEAIKHFGTDGWFIYGGLSYKSNPEYTYKRDISKDGEGNVIAAEIFDTPKGKLTSRTIYPEQNCDTHIEKLIKDFKEDFPKYKYLFPDLTGYDDSHYQQQKKELGELGMMCVGCFPPGMHLFVSIFEGSLEAATYAYYDYPELFEELNEMYSKHALQQLEMILEVKPDSILTGGSGSLTLQSPDMWRELALPTLKVITKRCKEAGVISGVHSCGREAELVKICAEETDLDYINPLEVPNMGDCSLSEIKRLYGDKLALMGNLHTTEIMLRGSVADVRNASIQAIKDAGQGGGFVLSTGDQCGRDTPEENIREMLAVCKEFGSYE
ncbi:MAG: uroporphyrinogen decarboxylase family protein [Saccharofermentanales bacterium]